jgi:hypothetical protein
VPQPIATKVATNAKAVAAQAAATSGQLLNEPEVQAAAAVVADARPDNDTEYPRQGCTTPPLHVANAADTLLHTTIAAPPAAARCSGLSRIVHSRMLLNLTPAHLKRASV